MAAEDKHSKMVNDVMNTAWGGSSWFQLLEPSKQAILLGLIRSGAMEIYRRWVADGKKIPLNDIIDMSNMSASRTPNFAGVQANQITIEGKFTERISHPR